MSAGCSGSVIPSGLPLTKRNDSGRRKRIGKLLDLGRGFKYKQIVDDAPRSAEANSGSLKPGWLRNIQKRLEKMNLRIGFKVAEREMSGGLLDFCFGLLGFGRH